MLIDKVDLVIFAACEQPLEVIGYLKRLINIRRIAQLCKGLYYVESAVCKNILAPAAADNKTVVLAALLDDRICIVQYRAVIRSAKAAVAQKQDIADLFDLFMRLYEAVIKPRRGRQQCVHDFLTLFGEGAHGLHAALSSAQL